MTDADAESDDPTPDIQELDEQTVQRIAAGEVVERPASVVKELVENSLDAGATRISVAVEQGGKEGVRVRDDGVGIPAAQLRNAVSEHATSKIGDIDDLEAGVGTLGFRGEALYTIGAVSRMTVRSRPRDEDGAGAELVVEGGDVGEVQPAGCPAGTTVEVEDLFFNTPARQKFLKTDATEFDHVNTVVTQYALANPDVAVSLEHNDREVFATEGNGDLRSTVLAVYGREVAEAMVEVDWGPDGAASDSPVQRIHGLVSHPETTRAGRDYLATFVNDRYVTANVLRNAVVDAYGGQIAPDRYPFAVLFVEVPSGSVDVNVHPRKMEVRFDDEATVTEQVEDAVESALLDHGLIRSTAPRGRSAPDEARIDPEADDGEVEGGAGTAHERAADLGDGGSDGGTAANDGDAGGFEDAAADAGFGDGTTADAADDGFRDDTAADAADDGFKDDTAAATTNAADTDDPTVATELGPDDEDAWTVEGMGTESTSGATEPADSSDGDSLGDASTSGTPPGHNAARTDSDTPSPRNWQTDVDEEDTGSAATEEPEPAATDTATDAPSGDPMADTSRTRAGDLGGRATAADAESDDPTQSPTRHVVDAASQRTLDGTETTAEREYEGLPRLRVLGQLHDTYVVAEAPDGLVLIDQHAADERVNYERLQAEFADGAATQALAEPVRVELTAREAALFAEYTDELAEIGFRAERAGDREVVVSGVPAVFDATLDPELLQDVLTSFVDEAGDGAAPVTDVVDELLADLACYPSVTGNTSLTEGSVVDLLDALDACENPYACPHGRPVVIEFDRENIEDRFERDYPGHSGRRAE
ncbi:DNA mismatch repair endonuclease MutL [Haloparvum sp. PAK95]|uniref:DNA mismatch repair endonuclease MutL n=1 Tax=Haloparvum sp. PAK95 TaxID=3418962 RepID=UPI003D2EB88C